MAHPSRTRARRRAPLALAAAVALAVAAAACSSGIPRPTDADVTRARQTWPQTTRADLERGRELYVAHCSGCHPLHAPREYPPDAWRGFVDEMAPRAMLRPDEADLVIRYLSAAARR